MTVNSQRLLLAAAGAGGAAGEGLYVDDVFSTFLYEGNDVNDRAITNGIDLSGEGGLVWIKARNVSYNNILQDTERGSTSSLKSNSTGEAETTSSRIKSFTSSGFTIGTDAQVNATGYDYVSWTFRKAPGFFDVVTYTGNGTAGRTVSHNLGSVPGVIIVKSLDDPNNWPVFHRSLGATKILELNYSDDATTTSAYWNDTEPTSTNFTLGSLGNVNGSGKNYVAYLFAHDDQSFGTNSDEAIIKCGSFTSGSFTTLLNINLGWEPQFFLVKKTSNSGDWWMIDTMRGFNSDGGNGPQNKALKANTSGVEAPDEYWRPTATGIEGFPSGGSESYIYMAIRRPHKPPEAGTDVFAIDVNTQSEPEYVSNFVVDWAFHFNITYGDNWDSYARLTGPNKLELNTTSGQSANSAAKFDFMNGWGDNLANNTNYRSWMFRRAPGFFDVVAYAGNLTAGHNVSHNLGVAPELMIIRVRDTGDDWVVYEKVNGATNYMRLNKTNATVANSFRWNDTEPTSSVFTLGTDGSVNNTNREYIAYLFASLSGVSKIGSYTGTGSNVGVDCGFTAGARFVLIKRTDSTGDWYVYDSTRGIIGGNDPYLLLNSTAAEVTNTDYIDPLNSGFTVTSSAPADLNASGGTYIFLAIA